MELEEYGALEGECEVLARHRADLFDAASACTDEHLFVLVVGGDDTRRDREGSIRSLSNIVNHNANRVRDLISHQQEHLLANELRNPEISRNICALLRGIQWFPLREEIEERIHEWREVLAALCGDVQRHDGRMSVRNELDVGIAPRPLTRREVGFVECEYVREVHGTNERMDSVLFRANLARGIYDIHDCIHTFERLPCRSIHCSCKGSRGRFHNTRCIDEHDLPARVVVDAADWNTRRLGEW